MPLIGIIWFFIAMAKRVPEGEDSPEAILKRRYAAGEITEEEYSRRLSALWK